MQSSMSQLQAAGGAGIVPDIVMVGGWEGNLGCAEFKI